MTIQPISRVYASTYTVKPPSFKGIIGKIRLFDVTNSSFDRLYTTQLIDYFQFTDDSPKEFDEVEAKYAFSERDRRKPLPSENIRFQKADESSFNLIKVPLTMVEYKNYLDNKLPLEEVNRIEYVLKDKGARDLLRKKVALLPLGRNLYKSLYCPTIAGFYI